MTNYIFDLAGVIINLDIERDTKALNYIGLPDFEGCLKRPEIAVPTLAYLNGLMPEKEYCETIRPVCRQDVTNEEILWAMDDVLDIIPESRIDMLMELRKEHKVYLLSNIYDRGWQIATEAFRKHGVEPEDCFDKLFLSHEMQLAKPDPRIFQAVIDATGISAEETLFFDDSRSNIATAKAMGFQAHLAPMNKLEDVFATEKIFC
jgi:putative hydrolase of the HAD superfamily